MNLRRLLMVSNDIRSADDVHVNVTGVLAAKASNPHNTQLDVGPSFFVAPSQLC